MIAEAALLRTVLAILETDPAPSAQVTAALVVIRNHAPPDPNAPKRGPRGGLSSTERSRRKRAEDATRDPLQPVAIRPASVAQTVASSVASVAPVASRTARSPDLSTDLGSSKPSSPVDQGGLVVPSNGTSNGSSHHNGNGAPLQLVATDATEADTGRSTRAPSSVDPKAAGWCRAFGIPEPTPGSEAAKFLDHWCGIPPSLKGSKTKVGWQGAWRNWMLRVDGNGRGKGPLSARRGSTWNQPAGGEWKPGEGERKAEEIP